MAKKANEMGLRLCIDAGHGNKNSGLNAGYDSGATAGGVAEADVALAWALAGRWLAKEYGIEVYLTRDDDSDPTPVGGRDEQAERAGCTHFLSIHCNSGGSAASGTETFYRDDRDKQWAAVVNAAGVAAMGGKNRGVKHESESARKRLAVFDFDGQAALLETGFITNAGDRKKVQQRDTRVAFWRHLFAAMKGESDG